MRTLPAYTTQEPSREALASARGVALLEFGAPWCPHCQAAAPAMASALDTLPDLAAMLSYWRIEDGKGRPLGRHFRVKLWPTFVLLRDGEEVARVVRPVSPESLAQALALLT